MTDPDVLARLAALESKVAELYQLVDAVEPARSTAIADAVPDEVRQLFLSGDREGAIRRLMELDGSSVLTATNRVNALEYGSGR